MEKYALTIFGILLGSVLWSQRVEIAPFPLSETIANLCEALENEDEVDDLSRKLNELALQPVSLNSDRIIELWMLGLISEFQWMEIKKYKSRYKNLLSVYELESIPGFNRNDLQRLMPFVSCSASDNSPVALVLSPGNLNRRMEIQFAARSIQEKQAGYVGIENESKMYQGNSIGYQFRFKYQLGKQITFALNAESDPGESISFGRNKYGIDFYSGYLRLSDRNNKAELILGNYKAGFGQGLCFDNAYSSGFSLDRAHEVKKFARGIRAYSGNDETNTLFGIAFRRKFKNWEMTHFASRFLRDASFVFGADSVLSIQSLHSTGLHRTINEVERRKNTAEITAGSNIILKLNSLYLGFTAVTRTYSSSKTIEEKMGSKLVTKDLITANLASDYQLNFRRFHFFGEWSINKNLEINQLHGLVLNPVNKVSFSFLFRKYTQENLMLNTAGLGQFSTNLNEKGFYSGVKISINKSFSLLAFADYTHNLWLRYRVNAPREYVVISSRLSYNPSLPIIIFAQYKYRQYPLNEDTFDYFQFPSISDYQQFRIQISYFPISSIRLQNRIELIQVREPGLSSSLGMLIMQDLKWAISPKLSGYFRLSLFDTETYQSRIYSGENDIYQSFSGIMLANQGERFYFIIQYKMDNGLQFAVKLARTIYSGAYTIGTAGEEIDGNTRTELRFKFSYRMYNEN